MRIIDITHPPQSLWIGREGENTFRPVSFECANWFSAYPNATIAAYYQPYGATDPYPLVLVEDGTKRIWHPLLNELVKGDGELQIVLMQGDTVGTSAIIPTKVDRSLISNAEHPASETPAWPVKVVQDVTAQADRAEAAVSHYPKIVNGVWFVWDATQSEFVSTGINAQGEDGVSPTVTVTEIEGGHRVTITDATGAHPFDVMDGEDGEGGGSANAVLYTPQSLSDSQKAQARTNVGAGTYSKPSGGIPASDLASGVQTSLGKADSAYQKPSGGIPTSDLASGVIPSVPQMATAADMSDWTRGKTVDALTLKSDFEGALQYLDSISSDIGQIQSDLSEKADKTEIPTAVSDLTNDSNFQTAAQVQSAIAAAAELPSGGTTGDFLRKTANGVAWQTVPSAESNSFGGGA